MVKKQDKRKRDIKSKLMAAICMLLVSSIMMVSSTYAWFTLSTAPEVTGITTAVGANGNLEMALLPTSGDEESITTGTGDSVKPIGERNITWGNLVDLSDDTIYGMDKITLNPAQLNVTEGAAGTADTLGTILLSTPTYGADGRIDKLEPNTTTGIYTPGSSNFPQSEEYTDFGVRAVGAASGLTDRQLAYRNSRSAANTAMAQGKNTAASSLNTNGNALANIAIAHGVDATAKHDQDDVNALLAIVDDLLGTTDKTGALQYIEKAYIQYIIAYAASQESVDLGVDDLKFNAIQSAMESATSIDEALTWLETNNVTLPTALYGTDASPINKLLATIDKVEEAGSELEGLTGGEYEWSEISDALHLLADTDAMTINTIPANKVTTDEGINHLVQTIGGGLTVEMATGGGVYADIADHCGDYSASIVIEELVYGSLTVRNMTARMATKSALPTPYLAGVGAVVTDAESPESTGAQVMPLTEMYGYVIDLAFRTNASESDLLLQTEARNRIYAEGGSEDTMGHGSTMTFAATTPDFSNDQVKNLMECIRLVFFVPAASDAEQNTVLAYGKLNVYGGDTGNTDLTTTTADGITADIVLYTDVTTTVTYEEATEGATHVYDADTQTYRTPNADETATHKEVTATSGGILTGKDAVITSLIQNKEQKVSVLVYLDGASITNADVAATASTSVTGTMNLQFSSSATLVPMDYIDYMAQGTGTNSSNNSQPTTNP